MSFSFLDVRWRVTEGHGVGNVLEYRDIYGEVRLGVPGHWFDLVVSCTAETHTPV